MNAPGIAEAVWFKSGRDGGVPGELPAWVRPIANSSQSASACSVVACASATRRFQLRKLDSTSPFC